MIHEAANPWLPKSPAESFSVWGRDATENDITLVISSGVVMRKQTIIQLIDPPKEDTPAEDPTAETPKQRLKLEYAVEFLNSEQKAVKLSLSEFPVIIGFLDGKIKKTDVGLKSFTSLKNDTEEGFESTLPSANADIKNDKPEIPEGKEAEEGEAITFPPDVSKFIPLLYITCGKDSFNELMLTGVKWIVESNIILGNNIVSSKKNNKPKKDEENSKPEDDDECEEGHPGEVEGGTDPKDINRVRHGGGGGGAGDGRESDDGKDKIPKAPCQQRGEDSGIPAPEKENVPGNVPPINPPANPPPNNPNQPNQPNNPPANPPPNPPENDNNDINSQVWEFINVYD